jgi:putative membrane protein
VRDNDDAGYRADPDSRARTHLANERTFLAWLRTGLGLIVLGLAAAQFIAVDRDLIPGLRVVFDFAAALIVGGALIVLIGGVRYFRGRDQIELARFEPAGPGIATAAGLVVAIAALSLVLVYLLGR